MSGLMEALAQHCSLILHVLVLLWDCHAFSRDPTHLEENPLVQMLPVNAFHLALSLISLPDPHIPASSGHALTHLRQTEGACVGGARFHGLSTSDQECAAHPVGHAGFLSPAAVSRGLRRALCHSPFLYCPCPFQISSSMSECLQLARRAVAFSFPVGLMDAIVSIARGKVSVKIWVDGLSDIQPCPPVGGPSPPAELGGEQQLQSQWKLRPPQ